MNTANVSAPEVRRPRRIWRWLLAGTGICLGAAALAAYNLVTLTRDAGSLRDELISTLTRSTRTQVQVTVGPVLLGVVRAVVSAFDGVPEEARLAMRTVRDASVGVYKIEGRVGSGERTQMFSAADDVMRQRGWTRVVGVSDEENLVLVYSPKGERSGSTEQVCVAVCNEEHLIVVEGSVRMDRLVELAAHHQLLARRM
jgi:hypothetical protein